MEAVRSMVWIFSGIAQSRQSKTPQVATVLLKQYLSSLMALPCEVLWK